MGRAFEVRKVAMAKTAASKSKVYAKFGKEIYMAAKSGTPDLDTNQNLKRIVDKAKKEQVPADVIKRAIDKAKGGSEESYSSVRYEGFGPLNTLFIIDCLTDNVNRTVAEVRAAFTKTGGKLGVTGSVLHQFMHKSIFVVKNITEDEALEIFINNDINISSMEDHENGLNIYGEPSDFFLIKKTLLDNKNDIEFDIEEITWIPITEVELTDEEEIKKFDKLQNMLDEIDDVQDVYNNAILN